MLFFPLFSSQLLEGLTHISRIHISDYSEDRTILLLFIIFIKSSPFSQFMCCLEHVFVILLSTFKGVKQLKCLYFFKNKAKLT